jgi:hypothetical protein
MPLAGITRDMSYVGHHLVMPNRPRPNKLVSIFADWLAAELGSAAPILEERPRPSTAQ